MSCAAFAHMLRYLPVLLLIACQAESLDDDAEDALSSRALTFSASGGAPTEPRRTALATIAAWGLQRFDWWVTDDNDGVIASIAGAFENRAVPLSIAFAGRLGARPGDAVINSAYARAELDAVLAFATAHTEQRFGWAEDDAAELEHLKRDTWQDPSFVAYACDRIKHARGAGAHFNLDLYGYCYDGGADNGYAKLVTLAQSMPAGCVAEVTLFVRTLDPDPSPMWSDATSGAAARACVRAVHAQLPSVKVNIGVFTAGYRPTQRHACAAGQTLSNGKCEIASQEAIHNVELARSVREADGFTFMQAPFNDTKLADYFVSRFTGNGKARFVK